MAVADLIIRQNDSTPVLPATIVDQNGAVVNLTGASVQFIMRSATAAKPQVNATATILSPSAGTVQYSWIAADTAIAGLYQAVFRVTLSGGGTFTYPNDGFLDIWIEPDLTSDLNQYLVSLPDIKDHLHIPATDRTHDQMLVRWVQAVRPVIENITGPIIPTAYDEWYDLSGCTYTVSLRHRPLITLTAVGMYLGPVEYAMSQVTQPQAGSIFSIMADGGRRLVRRGPGGSMIPFPAGYQSVHVLYTAGFNVVPENVRQATLELIRDNWVPTQQPGPRTGPGFQSVDDEIATHMPTSFTVSERVREWLSPNRRHPSIY